MKRILVHNFTRIGDLLQSTPLLMGLKDRDPECEIILAVHKRFQEVCEGFPFVDTVIAFDSDGLKDTILERGEGLLKSYRYVKFFINLLREQRFDIVYNLSHSRSSCILLSLLEIPEAVGSIADRTGTVCTKHPWANHFKNMSINRETSAFNLVDVYRRMGDVPGHYRRLMYEVLPGAQAAADRLLAELFASASHEPETSLLIGFQPGASQASRQWPASAFANLGKALCDELGARILVFGTAQEAALGEVITTACRGRAVSVMGKTSLAQLAALLQRCHLLVTNDTGTMHLASAVGTQVVALFMGPALFHQTGPYGEGHIVLQAEIPCAPCHYLLHCAHHICKEHLPWNAVLQIVNWVLSGKTGPAPYLGSGLGGYVSGFDEDGYLQFTPLTRRELDWATLLRLAYRETWKVLLDGKPLAQALATVRNHLAAYYTSPQNVAQLAHMHMETVTDCEHLYALAQHGGALGQELVGAANRQLYSMTHIQTLGKALEELDEQIRVLGATREALKPITATFRFGKENLQGWELRSLARQTQQLYESLAQQVKITSQVLAVGAEDFSMALTAESH
jgi:ADP-heptose:LPS heptosyltransferase